MIMHRTVHIISLTSEENQEWFSIVGSTHSSIYLLDYPLTMIMTWDEWQFSLRQFWIPTWCSFRVNNQRASHFLKLIIYIYICGSLQGVFHIKTLLELNVLVISLSHLTIRDKILKQLQNQRSTTIASINFFHC